MSREDLPYLLIIFGSSMTLLSSGMQCHNNAIDQAIMETEEKSTDKIDGLQREIEYLQEKLKLKEIEE